MADPPGSVATPISAELVRRELEAVLASKAFLNSVRLSRFLRHVVERALEGRAGDLKEYPLGLDVFGRNRSYDPRIDSVVRVEARQLRNKLSEYYAGPGQSGNLIITMPKGGYVPQFAWRLPEAPTAGTENAVSEPETTPGPQGHTRKAILAAGCVAGVAAIVGVLVAGGWYAGPPSIAVLPLVNLSADPANQYFSDGVTDEITDELAHLKTIRVIARSSAFQFKGRNVDIRDVGKQLNVATVLEGSVQRNGELVKIVVHLERVSDQSAIWSKTYTFPISGVGGVQAALAADVAANLGVRVGPSLKRRNLRDSEAYDGYLRGVFELEGGTLASLGRAEREFRHMIERDPDYASAYAYLGVSIWNRANARGTAFRTDDEMKSSLAAWRKAVELDPRLAGPHADIALALMQYQWDWKGADREAEASLAAAPSAIGETTAAFLAIYRRRFEEADEHLRRAVELDPFGARYNLALCRNLEGRYSEARETYRMLAARQPNALTPVIMTNLTYVFEGHPELGLPGILELEKRYPPAQFHEAMALARMGRRDEARKLLHELERHAQDPGTVMHSFALIHAMLGEDETAIDWLERSAAAHEFQALNIAIHPVFARLQSNPRLVALKKRMGLDQ
jgi:serine/threonine-protein kinase